MASLPEISIVSPVFNEEAVIETFVREVTAALGSRKISFELVLVDDGSRDRSFEIMQKLKAADPDRLRIVRLARNFGHQLAITAGMRTARGRAVVVMDCDLQDPPSVILQFVEKWREGHDVVYGVRTERRGETFFKKFTATIFYKLLHAATSIDIPEEAGDFYLLDRKVVDILNNMHERHRFMRGLIIWVGFKRTGVGYVREPRLAGYTKFSLWKMVKFSLDAATSFSFAPLRVIAIFGFLISLLAFVGILWTIYLKLFTSATITGWSSLMVAVLFIGGIQLLALGLIGEYIARIGDDVKSRPLYTVKEIL
jgi:dolichol-phosphate mannosyltransferase